MNRQEKIRRLRPEVLHFFDTNFLLRPPSDLPSMKNVPDGSRWITETVRQEAVKRLGDTAKGDIDSKFKTLAFRDLYQEDQRVCPVFYWFVLSMYNPATVGSQHFVDDLFESRLIKKSATPEEREAYERFRRQSGGEATKQAIAEPAFDRLRRIGGRLDKKARRSLEDRHPAYIRDIKSLALALYRSLSSRQNVVYHTGDGDASGLLIKWLDAITTWMTFLNNILPRLGVREKGSIRRGGEVSFDLNFAEFARQKTAMFNGMINDRRKTDACRFTVKHWSQTEKSVDESVYLVFENEIAGWLSNVHGPMSCPGAPNAELGNWLRIRYHWPPDADNPDKLRVEAYGKAVIRHPQKSIPTLEHDRKCRYRQDDFDGKIQDWSQFI